MAQHILKIHVAGCSIIVVTHVLLVFWRMPLFLPVPTPSGALKQLREAVIPTDLPPDSAIELVITVEDQNLNAREFAAFIRFLDGAFGRLTYPDYNSYARQPEAQLKFLSIRKGSLELVIQEALSHVDIATAIIILRYLLKYLPACAKDFASAYREYQEAAMVRERRRELRQQVKQDEELQRLTPERRNQLIQLLDALYHREQRQLPATKRFTDKYLRDIILRFLKRHG